MRRFALLALIAVISLGAGMVSVTPAQAADDITVLGPCSNCDFVVQNGNQTCVLTGCTPTGITDPFGNEYVICHYRCFVVL